MDLWNSLASLQTRRELFSRSALGIGSAALASLLASESNAGPKESDIVPGLAGLPHFKPKAKRVVYLFMNGAPPHLDTFDYKPEMEKHRGKEIPESIHKKQRLSTMTQGSKKLVLPPYPKFKKYGKSESWVCEYLPHTASIVDDLCFIKSMNSTSVNHSPGITYFLTGSETPGRPSVGAWLSYGLGSLNKNLPSFVAMTSRDKEASCGQIFYDYYWSAGFLPSKYQGVKFRGSGDPVLYLSDPAGLSREDRRALLDDLNFLNEKHHKEFGDPEIQTRMAQYEMAYQMQASVPELTDFSKETKETLELYGPDVKRSGSFAYNCLVARRLLERGCRFVQLMHAGWDHHRNLTYQFATQCKDTDQPAAALVKDLKRLGLLEDTLVIWGSEFGRTPFLQGDINDVKNWGRDHHPYVFTNWLAGGGVKAGTTYGESDEFAYNVAKDGVHVHDFQATMLHLLGIDHTKLTYKFQGRDYRLTDVHGEVVKGVLA